MSGIVAEFDFYHGRRTCLEAPQGWRTFHLSFWSDRETTGRIMDQNPRRRIKDNRDHHLACKRRSIKAHKACKGWSNEELWEKENLQRKEKSAKKKERSQKEKDSVSRHTICMNRTVLSLRGPFDH